MLLPPNTRQDGYDVPTERTSPRRFTDMANFDSGVKGYIKAVATVEVLFPIDWRDNAEIACKHCQFYSANSRTCALNKKIVNYPERYVGEFCPLEEVKEEIENVCESGAL